MCKVDLDKARVNVVLDKAKFNLTNVETTGVLGACNGWWFNPVRSLVLEPIVLGAADMILPPIAEAPLVGGLVAPVLSIFFGAIEHVHHVVSTTEQVIVSAIVDTTPCRHTNIALYGKTEDKSLFSIRKMFEWTEAFYELVTFLKEDGIMDEIEEVLTDELYSNLLLLERVQDSSDMRAAAEEKPPVSASQLPGKLQASKYMKFATAAYGITMMVVPEFLKVMEQPFEGIMDFLFAIPGAIIDTFPETLKALGFFVPPQEEIDSLAMLPATKGFMPFPAHGSNQDSRMQPGIQSYSMESAVEEQSLVTKMFHLIDHANAVFVCGPLRFMLKCIGILTFPLTYPMKRALAIANHISTKIVVSHYINIPMKDIVKMDVKPGGSMNTLRHFIAVDREEKAIVLVVRGTMSISGLLIDVTANANDYCCGRAHEGIAEMTDNLYDEVKDVLKREFEKESFNDYKLIITGHSLGAGVSCLFTLKLHHDGFHSHSHTYDTLSPYKGKEKTYTGRKIQCFSYASPAVYLPDDFGQRFVEDSFQCTTNYIHDNDMVPSLSVDAARRLFASISAVQYEMSQISCTYNPRLVIAVGAATDGDGLRIIEEAPRLVITASNIVWMKPHAGRFDFKVCDPYLYADGGIALSGLEMLTDHFPSQYQNAIESIDSFLP